MTEKIAGQLQRFVFRAEDSGYAVAVLHTERGRKATLVGTLGELRPGETIEAEGRWETDARHGRQFRVASYLPTVPHETEAMVRYLGSGLVKGIGPKTAAQIVAHFGEKTFSILDRKPHRVREVAGIGSVKAQQIAEAWQRVRQVREIGLLLQQAGAPRSLAVKILQAFGSEAYGIMTRDPYRAVGEIKGLGFHTADRIAQARKIAPDDPLRLRAGLMQALDSEVDDGHTAAPLDELTTAAVKLLGIERALIERQVEPLLAAGRLVREDEDGVWLLTTPPLAAAERRLAAALRRLRETPSRFRRIDEHKAIAWVEARLKLQLADNQRRAVTAAIAERVLVITGGPGTGKTTIVRAICEIGEKMNRRVALSAPTGRAAKRLAEASGRPAKTVHRLLEINPQLKRFERNQAYPLDADLVICDEASMLDVHLAMYLTDAVASGAHLVLVGDVDQLPSVGPGNVLADLIACPWIGTQRLTEIFRQAADSRIITGAHRIREGRLPELTGGRDSDFFFLEENDPAALAELAVDLVARRLPEAYGFDPLRDIMVLAPMHRGEAGVASLNQRLRERLNPAGPTLQMGERLFRVGDKVMQTANNYEYDIYNGDLGIVRQVLADPTGLLVDFDGRRLTLSRSDLDDLAPAYAVSVHKSQGSEYRAVVAPLHTQHYVMLARNLLYTAVTRGKELVVLCGSRAALERAVRNDTAQRRRTLLPKRLAEAAANHQP